MDTRDNWAHRSKGMRCFTCMWFVTKMVGDRPSTLGRCRRHAPTVSGFPAVYDSDWCGDHKVDEKHVEMGGPTTVPATLQTDVKQLKDHLVALGKGGEPGCC